jgi:glycosyltransferase involved in cell wall biosynthesis
LKVSIITPCYNSANSIGKTIDSIRAQTYNNIEYIVVDGASIDGTYDILQNRKSEIDYLISEKDKGIYDAINKGLEISSGDIIGILNSDDKFFDDKVIEKIVDVFNEKEDVNCVYGNLIFIDKKERIKRIWKSKNYRQGLFEESWTPAHPTFYCRSIVYKELGKYKIDYNIASDVDFMFRALEIKEYKSWFINDYLIKMSIGGVSNQGLKSMWVIIKEMRRSFYENNRRLNLPKYLLFKLLKIRELSYFSKLH